MSAKVKVSGAWKDSEIRVKVSGAWKNVEKGFVKVAGVWEAFLDAVLVAWDLQGATYSSNFLDLSGETTNTSGFFLSSDDSKLYVIDYNAEIVRQYTLSTPGDITTTDFLTLSTYDFSSENNTVSKIYNTISFSPDGTKMYIGATITNDIAQYTLSTAWDVTTASFDFYSEDILDQPGFFENLHDFTLSNDGLVLYILDANYGRIKQLDVVNAFDISDLTQSSDEFLANPINKFFIKPDGTKMYYRTDTTIRQYTLSTPGDITTASYDAVDFNYTSIDTDINTIHFKSDGTKMYLGSEVSDTIYEIDLV